MLKRRIVIGILAIVGGFSTMASAARTTIDLCGTWDVAQGTTMNDVIPASFGHTCHVPGIVNWGVVPPFNLPSSTTAMSGTPTTPFWYRKTFAISGDVPDIAKLKIFKAKYGTKVWLNGTLLGEHFSIYTPGYFDCTPALKGNGQQNTLVVRVGDRGSLPSYVADGDPGEKPSRVPGIHDSVQVILAGTPYIVRIQNVPNLSTNTVSVYVTMFSKILKQSIVNVSIYEDASGILAGKATSAPALVNPPNETEVKVDVPIANCRYWSTDDPFLYRMAVGTGEDSTVVRFGMRTITYGNTPAGYRLHLNGKPHMLLGTNIAIDRFEDDPMRNDLMWRDDWWHMVLRKFKQAHWSSFRCHLGLLPEVLYRVADEEGFLIDDEYGNAFGNRLSQAEAVSEFTEWIYQHANHPSIYVWDQQNEGGISPEGQGAVNLVRGLDKQNRAWQESGGPHDFREIHTYDFNGSMLQPLRWEPWDHPDAFNWATIDESSAFWLTRQGDDCRSWNYFDKYPTAQARRFHRYRITAAYAENQRANAWGMECGVAAYHDFVGLTNSPGPTGDHWLPDISNPQFVPEFLKYMPDAFSPLLVALDVDFKNKTAGARGPVRVVLLNDSLAGWSGLVRLRLLKGGSLVWDGLVRASVDPFHRTMVQFDNVTLPSSNGLCRYEAMIVKGPGVMQRTVRDVSIGTPAATDHFNYPVILPADVFDSLPDQTPPSTVTGLASSAVSGHSATLSWRPATDAESGILRYDIYRNDVLVASTMDTVVTDSGLTGTTGYTYQVAAVNGGYRQGTKSQPLSLNTTALKFQPAGVSIGKTGLTIERRGGALTVCYAVSTPQWVAIELFDSRGRPVRSLIKDEIAAGSHVLAVDCRKLAQGRYICRMLSAGRSWSAGITIAN